MGNKSKIILTAVVSVAATAFVTAGVTSYINKNWASFMPFAENGITDKINTVSALLDNMYLYDFDKSKLEDAAVAEYVDALDEPYTHYYSKQEFSDYIESSSDGYTGIGVVVTVNENNEIAVISTYENGPAYNAGILPGDVILKIDGKEYSGDELSEAVSSIKGAPDGEAVTLTVRQSGGEQKELTVTRGMIEITSVSGEMLDNGIGLVKISGFNPPPEGSDRSTYEEFKETIERLKGEGMKKLIIDLRDNPGGELKVVCGIADMLLPEGTILNIEYKSGKSEKYSSDKDALGIPMAVLINGNSASASEVLTGALKDYGIATIVGTKSFGKGIVQNVFPFSDGSGMSMTVAKYYTPSGVCIQDIGIEPDIEVEAPEEYADYYAAAVPRDEDTQLKAAIACLSE